MIILLNLYFNLNQILSNYTGNILRINAFELELFNNKSKTMES